MRKLETIQRRKLASAYGGFGSIVETKENGSLKIDDYDRWPCFSARQLRLYRQNRVDDSRLLRSLQNEYPTLSFLYPIPTDDLKDKIWSARGTEISSTKSASYFPTWFFCPKCRKLHRLSDWEAEWNNIFPTDNRFRENYPACAYCSSLLQNGKIKRRSLEQIRFCMASLESGDITDVPFEKLFDQNVVLGGEDTACDISNVQPNNVDLEYHTSASSDGLQSINIVSGNRAISMAQIARPFIVDNRQTGNHQFTPTAYKVLLRNGNNIYYPNVISRLYIPWDANRQLNPGESYDYQEYLYITEDNGYIYGVKSATDFYSVRYDNFSHRFIKKFFAIHRLKENSVIPSYTRVSSRYNRWWNISTNSVSDRMNPGHVQARSITSPNHFLPVVELYGEGLFMDINIDNINMDDRYKFVHTLSHIIMKELEFQCGYPLSSLKEKIYKTDDQTIYGILIYTVGGSEGGYGGLVSLLPTDPMANDGGDLIRLIDNAFERAKDCPNDPICEEEGAHCYACADIPEISCCNWNEDLDRRVINRYNH